MLSDQVLSKIAGQTSDEQFLEAAGLGQAARERTHDGWKLEQSLNDIHVVEMVGQPNTMATASRMGLTYGFVFDLSRRCWDLHVRLPYQIFWKKSTGTVDAVLQFRHEVFASYLDELGLKLIGTRWIYTKKGGAANPFVRARLVVCIRNPASERINA